MSDEQAVTHALKKNIPCCKCPKLKTDHRAKIVKPRESEEIAKAKNNLMVYLQVCLQISDYLQCEH